MCSSNLVRSAENERFPVELGWKRTNQTIDVTLIGSATTAVANYTTLLTTGVPVVTDKRRSVVVDSHFANPKFAV